MSVYTVTNVVGEPREWEGKYGKNLSYKIELQGHDGLVELSQKPETPAPTAGQQLEGEIQPNQNSQYPARFKRAQRGGNFGGGGGMSPEREKKIVRQHSQDMAIRTLELAVQIGAWKDAETVHSVADLIGAIKSVADVFDKDAGV